METHAKTFFVLLYGCSANSADFEFYCIFFRDGWRPWFLSVLLSVVSINSMRMYFCKPLNFVVMCVRNLSR